VVWGFRNCPRMLDTSPNDHKNAKHNSNNSAIPNASQLVQNWCESRKHQPLFTFSFVLLRTLPNGNRVTDRLDTIANLPPVAYTAFTAGWIKMALGMDVGLGPGHIALHGDPAPLPQKETEPPVFGPFLLWPNGCIYQDTT